MNTPLARAEKAVKEFNNSTVEQEIAHWRKAFKKKPSPKVLDLNRLHLFITVVIPNLWEELLYLRSFYDKQRAKIE